MLEEWDRATRSMIDGVVIIERINARGALVKALNKLHSSGLRLDPGIFRQPLEPV